MLALLEYQTYALSRSETPATRYPLGYEYFMNPGLYLQLSWAAGLLNNGYYGWRSGRMISFEHLDGRFERPDPWQNAASVAFQYYYSRLHSGAEYDRAIASEGFSLVYRALFGDPWQSDDPHIPVSLQQPALLLPFPVGITVSPTIGLLDKFLINKLLPYSGLATFISRKYPSIFKSDGGLL